jgi:hypothetical protein
MVLPRKTKRQIMTNETQSKTRRPRRMAREPGAAKPEAQPGGLCEGAAPRVESVAAKADPKPTAPSTIDTVSGLLRRAEGATLAEMVEATGWLPHTTRAALTGLKKKGHTIEKSKRDDVTCYNIVAGN